MTDQQTATRVVQQLFVNQQSAQSKNDVKDRLFVAHSIITTVLTDNVTNNFITEAQEAKLEEIEEELNKLRTELMQ